MKALVLRFCQNNSGATAIEYSILASLISVAILGTLSLVGDSIEQNFQTAADAFDQQ